MLWKAPTELITRASRQRLRSRQTLKAVRHRNAHTFHATSSIATTMATPRHSNQSYKYHPVEDPFPAQSKKSATKGVGKILCLQRAERGTDANDDANGFRVPKTSRDKNRSHSSSEGKMKVKDMLGYRDYASRNKIRTETKATDSKPRQAKTRTNSKAAPKHVQPMVSLVPIASILSCHILIIHSLCYGRFRISVRRTHLPFRAPSHWESKRS